MKVCVGYCDLNDIFRDGNTSSKSLPPSSFFVSSFFILYSLLLFMMPLSVLSCPTRPIPIKCPNQSFPECLFPCKKLTSGLFPDEGL